MLEYQQGNTFVRFGRDLNDVALWLKRNPREWTYQHSTTNPATNSWDLGVGYAKAEQLAETGWTEGAVSLANKLAVLPPNEAEPEYFHDVAGYMPDVPLYCAGDPMHMVNYGHPQGRKPIVHLVVNAVASAMIGADEYRNYGAAITAMVAQIEATGRQVELDVVFVDRLSKMEAVLGWKVKRAGDTIDLSAIAFSLAHPAAFRRIGFAMIERTPSRYATSSYGHCSSLTKELAETIGAGEAFLLGGVGVSSGSCSSMAGALKFAAQQINKAAGETLVDVRD
jgi:hypothetical protein